MLPSVRKRCTNLSPQSQQGRKASISSELESNVKKALNTVMRALKERPSDEALYSFAFWRPSRRGDI